MCGGRGLPLPLAMLGEIQLTLPIAARSPARDPVAEPAVHLDEV